MRAAILSDIHANAQALQAVLEHADRFAPGAEFWCLGDIFDRGPSPYPVWEVLSERYRGGHLTEWVAGNHDWAFIGQLPLPREDDRDTQGRHIRALQHVSRDGLVVYDIVKDLFQRMPVMVSPAAGVYLTHAGFGYDQPRLTLLECVDGDYLWGPKEITISNTWPKLRAFVENPTDDAHFVKRTVQWTPPALLIVGHTHIRNLIRLRDPRREKILPGEPHPLSLDPQNPVLLNPGSVGFCMNANDRCASYAVLDWNNVNPTVRFYRVPYDRAKTVALLRDKDYPDRFVKMLLNGECP